MSNTSGKVFDISHMCRCCMLQKGDMQSLFGSSIDTMLMTVTAVIVAPHDGLPSLICKPCLLLVSRTFTFKSLCEETDRKLRQPILAMPEPVVDAVPVSSMFLEPVAKNNGNNNVQLLFASIGEVPDADSTDYIIAYEGDTMPSAGSIVMTTIMPTRDDGTVMLNGLGMDITADEVPLGSQPNAETMSSMIIDGVLGPNDLCCSDEKEVYKPFKTFQLLDSNDESVQNTEFLITDSAGTVETEFILDAECPASQDQTLERRTDTVSKLPSPATCRVCHKVFDRYAKLRRHLRTHLVEKPHRCHVCGNTFAESSNLKKHMARHTGELRNVIGHPHLCSTCGKGFKFATSLSRHSKIHTRQSLYRCEHCSKCYTERSALEEHIYSHTNQKPFACPQCAKAFARKVNLVRHCRSHTGEKPFQCTECSKQFSHKSYLTIHLRIHANDKPYHCADCGKRFVASSGLRLHRQSHRATGAHDCALCGKCFRRKDSLNKHNCPASVSKTDLDTAS